MKLTEKVNIERLQQVLICNNLVYKKEFQNNKQKKLNENKRIYDYFHSFNGKDTKLVSYQPSKNSKFNNERLFSVGLGLQGIKREVRVYICDDMYYDFDFKNCHPNIIKMLLEKYEIPTPIQLNSYLNNREQFLSEFKITKDDFLSMINYFKCRNKVLEPIHSVIYEKLVPLLKEKHKELYDEYDGDKNNLEGSFFNHILNIYERKILDYTLTFVKDRYDLAPNVLCFDGFMILKEKLKDVDINDFVKSINDELGRYFSYGFEIVEKKMETDWRPVIDEGCELNILNTIKEKKVDDEYINDKYAAGRLCFLAKGKMVYCNTQDCIYVYNWRKGIWSCEDRDILSLVCDYSNHLIWKVGKTTKDYGGTIKNVKNMLKYVSNYATKYENFIEETIDTSKEKLLFKDGIYDMKTGNFTKGFNKKIVFLYYIDREFRDMYKINERLCNEIEKMLFKDPFYEDNQEDNCELLKQTLACGLAGRNDLKKFYRGVGPTNSSKGVISNALLKSCGGYASSFSASYLLTSKSSADEAKKMSWLDGKNNKRILIGNEGSNDPTRKIDSGLIKLIVGGGDEIDMRKNFKDEKTKTNRASIVWFMNQVKDYDLYDDAVRDRDVLQQFEITFVDVLDPDNENQKLKNPALKDLFRNNDDYKDAFLSILFKKYLSFDKWIQPDIIQQNKEEWVDNETPLKKVFDTYYCLTNNKEDVILVNEMIDRLLYDGRLGDIKRRTLEMELNMLAQSKRKFVEGKKIRYKIGVKEI